MKFFRFTVLCLVCLLPSAPAQQDADARYVAIYNAIQQADILAEGGRTREALEVYTDAGVRLEKFQKSYPGWDPGIISYRLADLQKKISALSPLVAQKKVVPPAPVVVPVAPVKNTVSDPSVELNAQLQLAQQQIQTLQAKLREALSVQPAAVDAGQLSAAQEQIRTLTKQVELLKTGQGTKPEKVIVTDTNEIARLRQQLAVSEKKLADEAAHSRLLADENAALQKNLARDTAAAGALSGLEKAALESKVSRLTVQLAENVTAFEDRLQELAKQNTGLQKQLEVATAKNSRSKLSAIASAQLAGLSNEVATLIARLAVAEARPLPFTPEELAMLKQPAPKMAQERRSLKELPPGATELVNAAQQHFARQEFAEAEADYLKILQLDTNNPVVLANLAMIEMQQDKLDPAEKHLQAAVAQSPDDTYNLSTLGFLKFRQEKYDEALDFLSRAVKLDPNNSEIQNYLGVTLSHKGLRQQAEAALRKAITIDPKYAPAHNNLALVYLSQDPPAAQLARKEYQQAVTAGQPRNPELEKMLADKGAPVTLDTP